jgi:hypothetical protein
MLAVFSRAWYLMLAAGLAASAMSLTVGRVRAQLPVAVAVAVPVPADAPLSADLLVEVEA